MPGKKFFITPNGNCSVFNSSQHPGSPYQSGSPQPARLVSNAPPTVSAWEGWSVSSSTLGKPGKRRSQDVPERFRPFIERPLDKPPRLKPLLDHPLEKGISRRKRPKACLTDLAPWELAELEYVEGMKAPSRSQQLCAALLERYCEPSKQPACGFTIGTTAPLSVVPDDTAPVAAGVPVRPKLLEPSGSRTPAAPTNSAPPMLLPSTPSTPRTADYSTRSLPAASPVKHAVLSRVTPLTLPGMKSIPPASIPFMGHISRAITPVKILDKLSVAAEGEIRSESPTLSPAQQDSENGEKRSSMCRTKWAVLSPFLSFLKRPRKAEESEDQGIEPIVNTSSLYSAHVSGGGTTDMTQLQMEAQSNSMGEKTLGLVDSLSRWIKVDKNGAGGGGPIQKHDSAIVNEITSAGDKAEIRSLIVFAKKYNLPVNDVREMKREFVEHDKEGTGEISWEDFQSLIRKRGNLPADKEIPAHLLQGMADRQPKEVASPRAEEGKGVGQDVGFEEFLRWSVLTAWSEEMLMPCPEERKIRQLARDQGMLLPDVERVKQLFDEFDTDGSGEIEEEEFRHILYKMLHVRDVTDVPIKRLERYWREVDLDGSGSIGFNEFLIWYKTSFSKDGKIELG